MNYKRDIRSFCLSLILAMFLCGTGYATTILSVDFGTSSSPLESGFIRQNTFSATHSGITVGITGTGRNFISRNNYVGTGSALFRDFLYSTQSSPLTIALSGLTGSTNYHLEIWSGDTMHNLVSVTDFLVNGATKTVSNSSGFPIDLDDPNYKTEFNVAADLIGGLTIVASKGAGDALGQAVRFNGFRLSTVPAPVPEPSTFFLLGSGLIGFAWYGRKRKKA